MCLGKGSAQFEGSWYVMAFVKYELGFDELLVWSDKDIFVAERNTIKVLEYCRELGERMKHRVGLRNSGAVRIDTKPAGGNDTVPQLDRGRSTIPGLSPISLIASQPGLEVDGSGMDGAEGDK